MLGAIVFIVLFLNDLFLCLIDLDLRNFSDANATLLKIQTMFCKH